MKLELYHVQQINVICEILRKKKANQEFLQAHVVYISVTFCDWILCECKRKITFIWVTFHDIERS